MVTGLERSVRYGRAVDLDMEEFGYAEAAEL